MLMLPQQIQTFTKTLRTHFYTKDFTPRIQIFESSYNVLCTGNDK